MSKCRKKMLPEYKALSVCGFILSFLCVIFIPLLSIVMLGYLAWCVRKLKKRLDAKKSIYHFIKDKESFDSIIESSCLVSLTGGRCYATSIFNPYLGLRFIDRDAIKYLLVIKGGGLSLFKPIISSYGDIFLPWKWWKYFRGECVSKSLKDIEFSCNDQPWKNEGKVYKRFCWNKPKKVVFCYLVISNMKDLPNDKKIYTFQKRLFWVGDIVVSLGCWVFILLGNFLFFTLLNSMLPVLSSVEVLKSLNNIIYTNLSSIIEHFLNHVVIYLVCFFILILFLLAEYFVLRKIVIDKRVKSQQAKRKVN